MRALTEDESRILAVRLPDPAAEWARIQTYAAGKGIDPEFFLAEQIAAAMNLLDGELAGVYSTRADRDAAAAKV